MCKWSGLVDQFKHVKVCIYELIVNGMDAHKKASRIDCAAFLLGENLPKMIKWKLCFCILIPSLK